MPLTDTACIAGWCRLVTSGPGPRHVTASPGGGAPAWIPYPMSSSPSGQHELLGNDANRNRHRGYYPSLHEAQLPRQDVKDLTDHQGGLLIARRKAGSRPRRHPQGGPRQSSIQVPREGVIRAISTSRGHTGKKEANALSSFERPVLYTGGALIQSNASQELTKFAEALSIPVTTPSWASGGIPGNHPLFHGMPNARTYAANWPTPNRTSSSPWSAL
jgi:hypothetical protein